MAGLTTKTGTLYLFKFKAFYLSTAFFLIFFLIGCGGGGGGSSDNSGGPGGGGSSALCGDISLEGVKNTANFPLYDLPTNIFSQDQVFTYYPIVNVEAYHNLLLDNGFALDFDSSNDTYKNYMHYLGTIGVVMRNTSSGFSEAAIIYVANQNLLNAITPSNTPLVQYQLVDHYIGERNFVNNHIDQYKSALYSSDFTDVDNNAYGGMDKKVGNCVYHWFYQHYDPYLNANDGVINYNWVVIDKTYFDLDL
ncbi:MAG: hypothetical protein LBH45_01925 [Campylobacteraceae bacterium]|jgi:hypothetical protein|nr:hypothetical protein [Campylobacteraceae bacterium]